MSFACAAALAMLTENQPEACMLIEAQGGIPALVQLLKTGGGQGKKAAAEALQAIAAECEGMRTRIADAGAMRSLVQMVQIGAALWKTLAADFAAHSRILLMGWMGAGNLQQQAAAAGALQALAYCPSAGPDLANSIAVHGGVAPLVTMLSSAPQPMRCAAAGALCNIAFGSPANQARNLSKNPLQTRHGKS